MSDASEGDALITAALALCPFCGGSPRIVEYGDGNGGNYAFVTCDDCGARAAEANYGRRDLAKQYWNRRAVLPALIRQSREEERERAAKIADDVAERKNAAQTEAHESRNEFAVGLFQVSEFTARAIAAAIRSTEPTP